MTVFQKIKTMFRTAKLLEMDNPIGEDLWHVSYHLNCVADEIARITNLLPKKNKEEIDWLVKITIQMKSKLN